MTRCQREVVEGDWFRCFLNTIHRTEARLPNPLKVMAVGMNVTGDKTVKSHGFLSLECGGCPCTAPWPKLFVICPFRDLIAKVATLRLSEILGSFCSSI